MDLFRKLGHTPEEGPSLRVETSCSIKRLLEDEELCCWASTFILKHRQRLAPKVLIKPKVTCANTTPPRPCTSTSFLLKATTEFKWNLVSTTLSIDRWTVWPWDRPLDRCWLISLWAFRRSRTKKCRVFTTAFVDATFSIAESEKSCREFFDRLNGLHPALQFTMDMEADNKLPFLDVFGPANKRPGRLVSF